VAATDRERYWVHFQVLRRMADFGQFQRIINYVAANTNDFPAPAAGQDSFQLQCYCYKAIALASTGHREEVINQVRGLLDLVPGDHELEAKFSEILGMYYEGANDTASATQLFVWAAENYPTHPWSNIGRLELAIQKYNAKDYPAAQKLTDDITNTLPENSRMVWIQKMYWGAVYLRGACLAAQGNTQAGEALKQTALSKCPGLNIQSRLH
jgi:tetratricopeptide (TPR) repeat protein